MKTGYDRFIVPVKNLIDALTEQKKEIVPKIRAALATFTNLVVDRTIKMTRTAKPSSTLSLGTIFWPDENFDPNNDTGKVPVAHDGLRYVPWGGYEVLGKDALPTSGYMNGLSVIYNSGNGHYLASSIDESYTFGMTHIKGALKHYNRHGVLINNRLLNTIPDNDLVALHIATSGTASIGITHTSYAVGGYFAAYIIKDLDNIYHLRGQILDAFLRNASTSEIYIDSMTTSTTKIMSTHVVYNSVTQKFIVSWLTQDSSNNIIAYASIINTDGTVNVDKTAISTSVAAANNTFTTIRSAFNTTYDRTAFFFGVSGIGVYTVSRVSSTLASYAANTAVASDSTAVVGNIAHNSFTGDYQVVYARSSGGTFYATAKTLNADGVTLANTVDVASHASGLEHVNNSYDATNAIFPVAWRDLSGAPYNIKAVRTVGASNAVTGSTMTVRLDNLTTDAGQPFVFYDSTLGKYIIYFLFGADQYQEVRNAWTDFTYISTNQVDSLNSLTGNVNISASTGIGVTTSSPTIYIDNTGVLKLNTLTGSPTIAAGAGIAVSTASPTITITGGISHFDQDLTTTTGLTFGRAAGKLRNDNTIYSIAAGTTALTNNATNYIEINSAGTISVNTTGFTAERIPLWEVVTSGGAQTATTDRRAIFQWYDPTPTGGVTSLNTYTGALSIVGGTGINVTNSSPVITISTSGSGTSKDLINFYYPGGGAATPATGVILGSITSSAVDSFQNEAPASSFTDQTTEINNATANDVTFETTAVNNAIYFGGTTKFSFISVNIGTNGSGTWTVTWEYYSGASWSTLTFGNQAITDFRDGTGTKINVFEPPSNWATVSVNSVTKYWVRARVSAYTSQTQRPLLTQAWLGLINTGTGLQIPNAGTLDVVTMNGATAAKYILINKTANTFTTATDTTAALTRSNVTDLSFTAADELIIQQVTTTTVPNIDFEIEYSPSGGGGGGHLGSGAVSSFRAYQTANQTLASDTWTKITFTTETYDNLSEYATGTSLFTAASNGIYLFYCSIFFLSITNTNRVAARFMKNTSTDIHRIHQYVPGSTITVAILAPTVLKLVAGDTIHVEANLLSGGSSATDYTDNITVFGGIRID